MTRFLLDTMVLSEGRRPTPDRALAAWLSEQSADACYLSALTIGELQHGIMRLPSDARRRAELMEWLHAVLIQQFCDRIVPFEVRAALAWGEILAMNRARGTALPIVDTQVAATAKAHGFTLVTRNVRHFLDLGIDLLNPWEG